MNFMPVYVVEIKRKHSDTRLNASNIYERKWLRWKWAVMHELHGFVELG